MSSTTTYTHLGNFAATKLAIGPAGSETDVITSSGIFIGTLALTASISVAKVTANGVIIGSAANTVAHVTTLKTSSTLSILGSATVSGSFSSSNLSGTNTGDVTISTANGLSLAAQALSMAAASSAATGTVTAGTQSFAGTKTFTTALAGTNVVSASSAASGVVTTGAQSFAGAKTFVSPLTGSNVASASSSASGVVTTSAQSFAGAKTFKSTVQATQGTFNSVIVGSAANTVAHVSTLRTTSTLGIKGNTSISGTLTVSSTITGSNLSGTNTGDLTYWSGSTKTNASWTTTSTTYVDGTNTGTNSLATKVSGISVTAGASNVAGITFTPPVSTAVYLIIATFSQWNSGANNNSFLLTDGILAIAARSTFGTTISEVTLQGIYAPASSSQQTVKIQMGTSGGTLHLDSETVSGRSTPTIEWTLVRLV